MWRAFAVHATLSRESNSGKSPCYLLSRIDTRNSLQSRVIALHSNYWYDDRQEEEKRLFCYLVSHFFLASLFLGLFPLECLFFFLLFTQVILFGSTRRTSFRIDSFARSAPSWGRRGRQNGCYRRSRPSSRTPITSIILRFFFPLSSPVTVSLSVSFCRSVPLAVSIWCPSPVISTTRSVSFSVPVTMITVIPTISFTFLLLPLSSFHFFLFVLFLCNFAKFTYFTSY